MRKSLLFLSSLLFISLISCSQLRSPIVWSFSSKKINLTTYELHMTATLDRQWHVYSQSTPEGGPIPTSFTFTNNPLVTRSGAVKEIGKLEEHFEELFGVNVKQFSGKVDFVQRVIVKAPNVKTAVAGNVEFMMCNDKECLPPKKQPFSIALN